MRNKFIKAVFPIALSAALLLSGCDEVMELKSDNESTPDTTVEETSAPETTTAETSATDTTTEETSTPDTTTEETSAPDTTTAETSTPDTTTEETSTPETDAPETSAPVLNVEDINSYRQIGENGILVAGMDGHYRGIMFFGGSSGYCDYYVEQVKAFSDALPNVKVCSMVIPTQVDFYNPPEYKGYTGFQRDTIDYTEGRLDELGITNIRVYDVLEQHKSENIYARTDHHWMPLGAYYAAREYVSALGLTISELSEYRAETCGGYVGSMYFYSKDLNLKNDPEEYTVYYSPNEDKLTTTYYDNYFSNGYESNLFVYDNAEGYYLSFLGTDDRITHVKTNVDNGRRLVVIKESFGNGLIPFFTEAFEDIYVLDLRYAKVNAVSFCENVGATDLLFANCAYTVAGGNCDYFYSIRTQ